VGPFSIKQGVIYFKGQIWLHPTLVFKHKIIQVLHASAVGGHSGFVVTYHCIKHLFSLAMVNKEIQEFVALVQYANKPNQNG
jgi:hypothetical protein